MAKGISNQQGPTMLKISHPGVLDNSRFTYSLNTYCMPCMVLKYFRVKKYSG